MLSRRPFNREEHTFRSPELENLLKDAIRFFNGTPVYNLPPPEKFIGSGVYAIYYKGIKGQDDPDTILQNIREYVELLNHGDLSDV